MKHCWKLALCALYIYIVLIICVRNLLYGGDSVRLETFVLSWTRSSSFPWMVWIWVDMWRSCRRTCRCLLKVLPRSCMTSMLCATTTAVCMADTTLVSWSTAFIALLDEPVVYKESKAVGTGWDGDRTILEWGFCVFFSLQCAWSVYQACSSTHRVCIVTALCVYFNQDGQNWYT